MALPSMECLCGGTLVGELIFKPQTCICGDEKWWPQELPNWLFYVAIRGYPTQEERQRNPSLPQYIQHIIFVHTRASAAPDVASAWIGIPKGVFIAPIIAKPTAQPELGMLEHDRWVYPGKDHAIFERKRETVVVKKA